jgi:hypothetical protein
MQTASILSIKTATTHPPLLEVHAKSPTHSTPSISMS